MKETIDSILGLCINIGVLLVASFISYLIERLYANGHKKNKQRLSSEN